MKLALLTTDNRENEREYHRLEPYFGTAPEALLEGFASCPQLSVHVISCTQRPVFSPEMLAPNIRFSSLYVPKRGWLRTGYQGCIRAVRQQLTKIKPDIVHGQGTERDCAISATLSGYPNVVTIHGNMAELARRFQSRPFSYSWLAARLEDWTLSRAGGVLCNSSYTEELVSPRAKRVWRVANALRSHFFLPAPSRDPVERPVILNVGVVTPRKRQVELLEALSQHEAPPWPFRLRFIGAVDPQTEYGRRFLTLLASEPFRSFAEHIGMCSGASLLRQFDSAHGLVHFPFEEAFGLVVAEALARNLQLFTTHLGGIVDIISGVPGPKSFDPDDWRGLASALVSWGQDRSRVSQNTQLSMQARFHPEVIARHHIEIYREVLGDRR